MTTIRFLLGLALILLRPQPEPIYSLYEDDEGIQPMDPRLVMP